METYVFLEHVPMIGLKEHPQLQKSKQATDLGKTHQYSIWVSVIEFNVLEEIETDHDHRFIDKVDIGEDSTRHILYHPFAICISSAVPSLSVE